MSARAVDGASGDAREGRPVAWRANGGFRTPTQTSFAESDAAIHSRGSRGLRRGTRIARTTARMTRTSTIRRSLAPALAPCGAPR